MSENDEIQEPQPELEGPPAPRPKAPPIESRFLFVDVAARRAKQLRRGALPRLADDAADTTVHRTEPHKAERIAMEVVRRRVVLYTTSNDVEPPPTS
jgi:DNA-directed RNA polymerase subunit K/omega